jgi:hypothetical protein
LNPGRYPALSRPDGVALRGANGVDFVRRAALEPESVDESNRTVDVVWSTGADVRRRDTVGHFVERLALDPAAVDLTRFIGAPVLNAHRQESLDNVIGVVTDASVDGVRGHGTVKFSERAAAIWADVKAGILRNVSVGYSVQAWKDSQENGTRVRTAVKWTPLELSFVAVPADAGATVRKDTMENQDTDATADRASVNQEIRKLVDAAKLDRSVADSLIDREADIDTAKRELFDAMLAKPTPHIRSQRIDVGENHDAAENIIERMSEALAVRMDGGKVTDAARPYMHRRLVDLAAELLEARGERTRLMSPDTIFTRAGMHTTGDFPNLLTSTGNRVLMAAFQAAPNPLRSLARQVTTPDFRSRTVLKLSEFSQLAKVNEAGEVTYGTRTEAKEAYSIATYAKLFSISRQALINDDLGAFADFSRAAGRAAAETEASVLTTLLTQASGAGPTLDDGVALFNSAHGNLAGSGGAISTTTLSAARLAMRSQTGVDGVTPINATPRFLLVSATKETEAQTVLASITPATVTDVNVFSNSLTLLVEPRLSGNPWYVLADPAVLPVLEYAYLSSAQGPQMSSREGWDVLGMEFRCVLDFGAGVVDYRGAYRNPGA